MVERSTLKILKGRFCGDLIVASKGVASLDIFLQNEGRLACGQFSCVDRFSTTPTREDGLSRCSQIAYPVHDSIRGIHIAHPILLNNHYRDSTRMPAFEPTHLMLIHVVILRL